MTTSVDRRKVKQPPQVKGKITLTDEALIVMIQSTKMWLKTNLMLTNQMQVPLFSQ